MTTHVLTVGTSIGKHVAAAIGGRLEVALEQGFEELRAALGDREVPEGAEMTGLRLVAPSPLGRADDHVVLLASDSDAGRAAALVNAVIVGGPIQRREAPGSPAQRVGDGLGVCPVTIVGIPSLDPEADFVKGAGNLARALAWSAGLDASTDGLVLHSHGGYKAAIPFLTACAEFLEQPRGWDAARGPWVRMVNVHENHPVMLELPLRRASSAAFEELDEALRGREPYADTLLGWAYTVEGDRCRLTAIGEALAAVRRERDIP